MQHIEFTEDTASLYGKFNRPQRQLSELLSVQALFEHQANATPDSVALICGTERRTYAELNTRANALAKALIKRGVANGEMVAISCPRSLALIECLIAIVKCGAAYVPLDPNWPVTRQKVLLGETGCKTVIAGDKDSADALTSLCDVVSLDNLEISSEVKNPPHLCDLDTIMYVNFTSGSTGKPKGVPIPHVGVLRLVNEANYVPLDEKTRTLQLAPIAFDAATFEIWAPLLNGGTCVLYDKDTVQLSNIRKTITDGSVNTVFLTTALFNTIIDVAPNTLESVRHILTGGEAHSTKHMLEALDHYGTETITSVYGPTECTTFSSFFPVVQAPRASLPIGKPIQNTSIYVLDGNRACDIGEAGLLHIAGPGLASGYLNNSEKTDRRFRTMMIEGTPHRIYDTGDLGMMNSDLDIEFLGREDDQVKVNGYRIELGEVADQVNRLTGVQQCFVTTTKSAGEETRLLAFVLVDNEACQAETLKKALKAVLPNYMVPHLVTRTSPFPLTPTHKIDKKALLECMASPKSDLKKSAEKIRNLLSAKGVNTQVRELPGSTRTAFDAAETLNCEVAQIVKSLIFHTVEGMQPVVVLASGSNRVDTKAVSAIVGQAIKQASPKFVRETTGFAIGGVPPIGHLVPTQVIVDEDLTLQTTVWAAAGTPNAVFQINQPITSILHDFRVADIKEKLDA